MTPFDAALYYAQLGWRTVPILAGTKRPPMTAWQEAATTDPAVIRQWYATWPDAGVGIATGPGSGVFVLDVDVSDGKAGDETLFDLEATHGPLPETVRAITGSGGQHVFFRYPADGEVRNDAGKRLGSGLDIRGDGGQVVAAPTVHPDSGRAYEWEIGYGPDEVAVAEAPEWLLALLRRVPGSEQPRPRRPEPTPDNPHDAPGDRFEAMTTWPDLLEADGATLLEERLEYRTRTTYEMWARPGVDHASGTLYYMGSDVLKVFSSNWGGVDPVTQRAWLLEQDATYTRFGYYAARFHGGDHSKAAQALAQRFAAQDAARAKAELLRDWQPTIPLPAPAPVDEWVAPPTIDVELVEAQRVLLGVAASAQRQGDRARFDAVHRALGELQRPLEGLSEPFEPVDGAAVLQAILTGSTTLLKPTLGLRTDGAALFYPGLVNGAMGESGSGKSFMCQFVAAEVMRGGRGAVYLDWEDHEESVYSRMFSMIGIPAVLIDHFSYFRMTDKLDDERLRVVDALIAERDVGLIVVDSVGEAMALDGVKQNDDDAVAAWFRRVPRRWADLGPAVIVIDHVSKNPETRGLYAIGSQRKRAAITGHAVMVEQVKPFAKEQKGVARIVTAKDRHGAYGRGHVVAEFILDDRPETKPQVVELAVPAATTSSDGSFRPTGIMEKVSRYLELSPAGRSKNDVEGYVRGKATWKRTAMAALVEEGYITEERMGQTHQLKSLKPFREDEDRLDLVPSSQPRPTSSQDEDRHTHS